MWIIRAPPMKNSPKDPITIQMEKDLEVDALAAESPFVLLFSRITFSPEMQKKRPRRVSAIAYKMAAVLITQNAGI
jgi:hypothetical protein